MEINTHEIWKDVEGFEGIYQISNFGRLKSYKVNPKVGYILSNVNKKGGYFSVVLLADKSPYGVNKRVRKQAGGYVWKFEEGQ